MKDEIPFGVADARARGGSRTAEAATPIFHAWVVYVPLKRCDTVRDALDLVSYANFLHGLFSMPTARVGTCSSKDGNPLDRKKSGKRTARVGFEFTGEQSLSLLLDQNPQ